MRTYWLLIFGWLLPKFSPAQGKESTLGVRVGGSAGVTYKKFSSGNFAFEGIVAKDFDRHQDGVFVAGLFQNNAPLAGKRFSAIVGGGPAYHFARKSFGAAGILGFDWRVFNSPINLQVDWMPTLYFSGENKYTFINTAFSLRYILNRRKLSGRDKNKPTDNLNQDSRTVPLRSNDYKLVTDTLNNNRPYR